MDEPPPPAVAVALELLDALPGRLASVPVHHRRAEGTAVVAAALRHGVPLAQVRDALYRGAAHVEQPLRNLRYRLRLLARLAGLDHVPRPPAPHRHPGCDRCADDPHGWVEGAGGRWARCPCRSAPAALPALVPA